MCRTTTARPSTGYDLRRWDPDPDNNADTDGGAWETANLIAAGVTVTEFVDIGNDTNDNGVIDGGEETLEAGTTYYYRVRALAAEC